MRKLWKWLFGKDDQPVRRTVWSESLILPTAKAEHIKAISEIPRQTTWTLPSGDVVEFD